MSNEILSVSQDICFYTLEGEGEFIGYPSVFLRLAGCNLTCAGFISEDSPHGCDSYISWSVHNRFTFEELAKYFEDNKLNEKLYYGALLKVTGGEPLIQQKRLIKFIDYIVDKWGFKPRIDFETNATIIPDNYWVNYGATFTTSPKIKSNGDPEHKRYKPEVLKWHVEHNSSFKFVVQNKEDIAEVLEKYVLEPTIKVPRERVWLMPCCGSREELLKNGPQVAEWCKEYVLKFSNRMHLQLWDMALTV